MNNYFLCWVSLCDFVCLLLSFCLHTNTHTHIYLIPLKGIPYENKFRKKKSRAYYDLRKMNTDKIHYLNHAPWKRKTVYNLYRLFLIQASIS